MSSEMRLINPRGNDEIARQMCDLISQRAEEMLDGIAAIEITEANFESEIVKNLMETTGAAVEELRDCGKRLIEECLDAVNAKRIISQIDNRLWNYSTKKDPNAAYIKIKAAYDEKKAQIKSFKDAHKVQAKPRTHVVAFEATDKQLEAILKAAEKAGAKVMATATPQSDAAFKKIQTWLAANA